MAVLLASPSASGGPVASCRVYDALAEGVTVSLGTDWTPTGSKTLLDEYLRRGSPLATADPHG